MTTINADMTSTQTTVPVADPTLAPGFYIIDAENVEVLGNERGVVTGDSWDRIGGARHKNVTSPKAVLCVRAVGGSTAATHSSGATMTRYYPDGPGGDGEPFNGGTITDPLVIRAATALDGDVFHVSFGSDTGSGVWVQQVVDGDPLAVTATNLTVRALGAAQSGSIAVYGPETETDFPGVSLGGNGYIRTFTQTGVLAIAAFDAPGNVLRFALLPAGQIMTGVVTAPADEDLSASQVAFWFDDTNGAAKLKIKGKSANGTVVTGTVNLT